MSTLPIRVLLVEDDEEDCLLTKKLLANTQREFDIKWVRSCDAALEELRTPPYDVCLVDYRIGAESGINLIQKAITSGFRGPMILLTGQGDQKVDAEAMKVGAADYLVKDEVSPQLLERVIRHSIERRAEDLTHRRTEEQLRQAQKMEAIGNLAGGVAHDFNNLLSVILSYSEMLACDLKFGDPMRVDLQEINAAAKRAAALTKQLLTFSRQQVLQPQVVDINLVFAGMETMLQRMLGEDVELTCLSNVKVQSIWADPGQLEQVIMNLTINARDAMPHGGKLTIGTSDVVLDEDFASQHLGMKAGPHIMLAMSDSGTGMDEATQRRIFEPFFTTKDVSKGTGLGLSTVFGIVQQSGGTISVYSEVGIGTTFKIYFPAMVGVVVTQPLPVAPDIGALHGDETILLVEDEQHVRNLTRTILRKYGYNVLEAHGGGDAFLLCEQYTATIDLLLTDVVMPRVSGRQVAERLQPLRPEMKVLYMSGYTDDAVVRHGILESTIAFIQKPITPEALARKVREVLGPVAHTAN